MVTRHNADGVWRRAHYENQLVAGSQSRLFDVIMRNLHAQERNNERTRYREVTT